MCGSYSLRLCKVYAMHALWQPVVMQDRMTIQVVIVHAHVLLWEMALSWYKSPASCS